jgi:hypothetical protein
VYNLDLREALWGEDAVGVRHLIALVRHLPDGSAVTRAAGGWSQKEELLATVVDTLGVSNHMYLMAHSEKGTKLPDPVHFPRPWEDLKQEEAEVDTTARAASTTDDVRAFFGTMAEDVNQVRIEH